MDDGLQSYRVLRLVSENYKRLQMIDVTPGRNVVVVTGRNKAGKSSLLDAIAAVLGGKKQVAAKPIRTGADSAQIVCILGDDKPELLVKRVFSADGKTSLEITSAGGFKAPSPQAILDSLCGAIAFDPLSFVRMDDRAQLETLRKLVGLDFSEVDAERKKLYDQRTAAHRETKRFDTLALALRETIPDDTPETEVSVLDLAAERKRREMVNRQHFEARSDAAGLLTQERSNQRAVESLRAQVVAAETRLAEARQQLQEAVEAVEAARLKRLEKQQAVGHLVDEDVDEVTDQMAAATEINRNVAKRRQLTEFSVEANHHAAHALHLTEEIAALDAGKEKQLAAVQWPIDGLAFGEDGVMYNGLPFSQASGAEQLVVSFAMSSALHPRLKVALIRDASLLDEDQLAIVCDLAKRHDTQVWLEIVDAEAGPCRILIEDGTCVPPSEDIPPKEYSDE